MPLYCDYLSAINISIRDLVENKHNSLEHISTKNQVADIFTKAQGANKFEALRATLGLCVLKA